MFINYDHFEVKLYLKGNDVKGEGEEDENLETYEDIINFNPANHTYNESKKNIKQATNNKNY